MTNSPTRLGHFPDPYPDEYFLSLYARFCNRLQFSSRQQVALALFGVKRLPQSINHPFYLDALIARLPLGHCLTAEDILNKHSLVPLYIPFMTVAGAKIYCAQRRAEYPQRVVNRLLPLKNTNLPKSPMFCPLCAHDDIELFGETYWHRTHQAPGVRVCLKHDVYLEPSGLSWTFITHIPYPLASHRLSVNTPQLIGPPPADFQVLVEIAQNVSWLLEQRNLSLSIKLIHDRFLNLFREQDYTFPEGQIRFNKFIPAIQARYSEKLLSILDDNLTDESGSHWLYGYIRQVKKGWLSTTQGLLLMHFLGYTAEQFFSMPITEVGPFRDGLWPRLKPCL